MFNKILNTTFSLFLLFFQINSYANESTITTTEPIAPMFPIKTGSFTLYTENFDSVGNAKVFVPVQCPAPYVYPYVMAYPSVIRPGVGVFTYSDADCGRLLVHSLVVSTSSCVSSNNSGCNLSITFQGHIATSIETYTWPATKDFDKECTPTPATDPGRLTVSYMAYCSSKPVVPEKLDVRSGQITK
ncbi:MAG: hypothetical protein M1561_02815 [Gammaproteobacteria bacterium]|nr:hypothetical protein [Gammaproteobacteria bacterium]